MRLGVCAPGVSARRRNRTSRIDKRRMRLIRGLSLRIGRALARILDAEKETPPARVPRAAHHALLAFDEHATERDVDREAFAIVRPTGVQATLGIDRRNIHQAADNCVADRRPLRRRFDERRNRRRRRASARACARITPASERAQDFRIAASAAAARNRPRHKVENRRPGRRARWRPLALIGGRLRNRLDVQALELIALAVTLDARGAGIDHVADAWHGQRSLGDIGRQHDASLRPGSGIRDPARPPGQPRIQREHFSFRDTCGATARDAYRVFRARPAGIPERRRAGPRR